MERGCTVHGGSIKLKQGWESKVRIGESKEKTMKRKSKWDEQFMYVYTNARCRWWGISGKRSEVGVLLDPPDYI